MRIIVSAILLILALHFMLSSVTFRSVINLENFGTKEVDKREKKYKKVKENYESNKQELLDYINCQKSNVAESNLYPFNENDANFGSDVLNLNRFFKQNIPEDPPKTTKYPPRPVSQNQIDNINSKPDNHNLQPNNWRYNNELPMNGGEILPGLTGYDTLSTEFAINNNFSSIDGCNPPTRGSEMNDDLRMGMGKLNSEN